VNSRPFDGRSSETQPHPVDMINKSHSSVINILLCVYITGICVEGLKRHFDRDFRSPGSSPGAVPESVQPSSGTVKKSRPSARHGGAWRERKYSSYTFTTSALDRGEWSASRPGRTLPLGKGPPVPIVQAAGWAPEPVWTQRLEEKSFAPVGDRTPIARSSSQTSSGTVAAPSGPVSCPQSLQFITIVQFDGM
jgi:hypothetical protein